MSGSRYWNSSRPKYINGEPDDHLQAKKKIAKILERHNYTVWLEYNIAEYKPILHKGRWFNEWYVDGFAYNQYHLEDRIIYQIDGGYHQASKIQKGRTKNRDQTLRIYCSNYEIRYVVFDSVEDVLSPDGYTDEQLIELLGLKH